MASNSDFGYNIGEVFKENYEDLIFVLKEDFKCEYVNKKIHLEKLGYISLNEKIFNVVHPEDIPNCQKYLQKLLKHGKATETLRIRQKEGFEYYEFKGKLFRNSNQEIKLFLTARNISFFQLKYSDIVENIVEAYFEVDLEGTFTFMNKSFSQMTGYALNEMIGKNYKLLMDEENKNRVFKVFNTVYKTGKPADSFRFEFIKKGNERVIVETSVYLNKDNIGNKVGFYGISRDITQKFKLEQRLKQSEEKYRHLFEKSPYAIWIVDLNGTLIDCNATTDVMLSAFTREDLIGKNFVEILNMFERPEHFISLIRSKFTSFVKGESMKPLELKMTRKDGLDIWINLTSSKIKLGEETLIQVLIQDVTEKKNADLRLQKSEEELKVLNKELERIVSERTKELRESEQKFRTIAENSLMGIAILQDNKVKYANQLVSNLGGFTINEVLALGPTKIFEHIHPQDRIRVMEQLSKKQHGESDYISNYQYRLITKSGDIRWLDNYSKSIDFLGEPADLISVIDITERKNAEQKLKESEQMFRTIAEHSAIGITILQDNKVIYANEAMSRISGYSIDEMLSWTSNEMINQVYDEDREAAEERLRSRLFDEKNISDTDSYRITTKNGEIKRIESYSKTIMYQNKFADLALIMDVTEQNLAQERLRESEEKYRSLFENMNTAFAYHEVIVDENNKPCDYRYLEANIHFEEMTGIKINNLIGKTVTEVLPGIENDPADWIGRFGAVGLTGEPINIEDYSEPLGRWYKVSGYSPKRGYFAVTFSDITDRKMAEIKIKESEEKYRHLYENSPFSIVLLDYDGKVLDMNTKTTDLFGYNKADLLGKNYLQLAGIYPDETKPNLRLISELIDKGEPSRIIMKPQTIKIFDKHSKPLWVSSELSTIKLGDEIVIQAIIQDITEKKIAEEKLIESEKILRQQNIELKELDRLKTDFISIAAHDLKTPLISVGGYIDLILLREKKLGEEIKEDLGRVLNNVHRLEEYINRLLDVMKIDAKKVELVKREENVHELINNCLLELEFQIRQKKLTINLEISKDLNLEVDHFRISQVFLNLLSNAVKFTSNGGDITILVDEDDESLIFSIEDNGKGLTPEEIDKIFGKFVSIEQGVDGYSTLNKGSGLGLYIAKGFIEAHGGKIWVESKGRDLGTKFSFTLPKD
ncbi:MAG: PAS domain S-box protein [Candidatus Lokiarchaeota archaeon]|nr:PAS domain S-box protein [Candidatus Lokiarchaeota archaeon]